MLKIRRVIATLLVACIAMPLPSYADMLATDAALSPPQRDRIMVLLQRADVRQRLEAYGVSMADVQARVASLSDHEVAQLAGDIDGLPAGGVDVIGAIVLVFIVLLITDILGYTNVFPFTRSSR